MTKVGIKIGSMLFELNAGPAFDALQQKLNTDNLKHKVTFKANSMGDELCKQMR